MIGVLYACLTFAYWNNKQIHNLGNTGLTGNIHAMSAPLVTKYIDREIYGGRNIREEIYDSLEGSVLDLCCGTGFSTKPAHVGVDTSLAMLRFANIYNPGSHYIFGNAETYGETNEYDTVTIMFAFHEMPRRAHRRILRNAIRVARKRVVVVDISCDYKPSKTMLSGEPYLLDYLDQFPRTINNLWPKEYKESPMWNSTALVKNHVHLWECSP